MYSFKRFIARRGKPDKVYSDNAKTFVAAAKRVHKISKDDQINDYLAKNNIKWQFNLSKAPWWGGQYERLIGLVKQAFLLPGECRGEQTRFDFWLNGLAPRAGVNSLRFPDASTSLGW
jgi:hypothetical protein